MLDDGTIDALAARTTSMVPAGTDAEARSAAVPTPLAHSLGDARIVGLGEATHGTRECFEHKHRLIRHLVTERGFRTVAFEADAAATTALDAFVRGGSPFARLSADAESALAELDMWQWRTESVRALLDWLRAFNDGRAPADQVRIRGVDLSTPSAPAAPLQAYFERIDPDAEIEQLRTVADATVSDDDDRERVLETVTAAAEQIRERLDATRDADEASRDAWRTARWLCRVIEQSCEWARVRHEQPGPHPAGMAARDRFMAENARRALERDPGMGVVLWAHDGHVQRGSFDDGTVWADATTMGERLARALGDDYRPVGFDFARGSFRAVGRESGEVETFSVGSPTEDSATAAFAAVGDAPYALDLDAVADDDRLAQWATAEQRKRYVGSVFDPAEEGYARTDLPGSFDWLLVLPESTPTIAVDGERQNP
ncbi:erythromycin esterase family protein [Halolamina salina]|uniref:Erythromycin esterase family protein n=1 Tax=Halolamina salina TaxID=1220023 RepID=A0ABD6B8L0_9EURY